METLAPSILEVRNSFLEQFKNEQLVTISKKLDQLFDVEKDPVKRIVLLASRVETIRKRIEQIYQNENTNKKIIENSNEKTEVKATSETDKTEKTRSGRPPAQAWPPPAGLGKLKKLKKLRPLDGVFSVSRGQLAVARPGKLKQLKKLRPLDTVFSVYTVKEMDHSAGL